MRVQRAAWHKQFAVIDASRLVFLDESGATTAMTRRYARARAASGSTRRCRTATGKS